MRQRSGHRSDLHDPTILAVSMRECLDNTIDSCHLNNQPDIIIVDIESIQQSSLWVYLPIIVWAAPFDLDWSIAHNQTKWSYLPSQHWHCQPSMMPNNTSTIMTNPCVLQQSLVRYEPNDDKQHHTLQALPSLSSHLNNTTQVNRCLRHLFNHQSKHRLFLPKLSMSWRWTTCRYKQTSTSHFLMMPHCGRRRPVAPCPWAIMTFSLLHLTVPYSVQSAAPTTRVHRQAVGVNHLKRCQPCPESCSMFLSLEKH